MKLWCLWLDGRSSKKSKIKTASMRRCLWKTCGKVACNANSADLACQVPYRMLQFCQMKNFLAVVFRFLITFIVVDLCLTLVWTVGAALDRGAGAVPTILGSIMVWAIPGSITAALFISFFLVNRLFASRIAGYMVLLFISIAVAASAGLIVRLYYTGYKADPTALPSLYIPIARWFMAVSAAPWIDFSASLCAFAAMNAGCWGLTRLSRTRPLFGAFIAPSGALGLLYLFSIYLSGPADALFTLAGIQLSRLMTTAALAACTSLGLILFDVLFAMKPMGAPRHG